MEGKWSKEITGISFPSTERCHVKSPTICPSPGMGITHRKIRCKHIMDQSLKEENPSPTSQITHTITIYDICHKCWLLQNQPWTLFVFISCTVNQCISNKTCREKEDKLYYLRKRTKDTMSTWPFRINMNLWPKRTNAPKWAEDEVIWNRFEWNIPSSLGTWFCHLWTSRIGCKTSRLWKTTTDVRVPIGGGWATYGNRFVKGVSFFRMFKVKTHRLQIIPMILWYPMWNTASYQYPFYIHIESQTYIHTYSKDSG